MATRVPRPLRSTARHRQTVAVTIARVPDAAALDRPARPARRRGRRAPARGRHAQGDGAARLPRDRGPSAAARHDRRRCSGPRTTRSARARRCGARSRRCAPRSAAAGSRPTASSSRSAATGIRLDVAELRRLVAECATHGHPAGETCERCLEPLRAAAALDRGPFLAGFGLRDSTDVRRLAAAHRRPARAASSARVLDRLADALAAAGDHAQAIATARRRLALDPLHEPAHRRLIRVVRGGRRPRGRARAVPRLRARARPRARRAAARRDDRALPRRARGHVARRPRPPPAPPPEPERVSALVGRDRELDALREAYRAVGPDGRLAVLVGEAGIGKTRLGARAARPRSPRPAARAASARCFQEESELAYGVVSGLLRDALAAGGPPEGDAVVGRGGLAPRARARAAARARRSTAPPPRCGSTRRSARSCSTGSAARRPALVLVDDAHWADEASLRLLLFLAHRLRRPAAAARRRAGSPRRSRRSIRSARCSPRRGATGRRACSRSAASRPPTSTELVARRRPQRRARRAAPPRERRPAVLRRRVPRRARPRGAGRRRLAAARRHPRAARHAPRGARRAGGARSSPPRPCSARSFDPDTLRDASGRSDDEVVLGASRSSRRAACSSRATGRSSSATSRSAASSTRG